MFLHVWRCAWIRDLILAINRGGLCMNAIVERRGDTAVHELRKSILHEAPLQFNWDAAIMAISGNYTSVMQWLFETNQMDPEQAMYIASKFGNLQVVKMMYPIVKQKYSDDLNKLFVHLLVPSMDQLVILDWILEQAVFEDCPTSIREGWEYTW